MNISKKELRQAIRNQKEANKATMPSDSILIMSEVEKNPIFQASKIVLLYHSLSDEVATHLFIKKWAKSKTILLPAVVGDNLELRLYNGDESLKTGSFNICEPGKSQTFNDFCSVGFAAIPGMAFDIRGNRLGRGKGYYDKLLPKMPQTFKAGICFQWQIVDSVPSELHDIKMDTIISSSGFHQIVS